MANLGVVETLLGGLPSDVKKVFVQVFRSLVPNQRFGPVEHQVKCENFLGYTLNSTTAASTGEFSIEHGLDHAPFRMMPAADLTAIGSGFVPVEVTRAADGKRVYLKSSVTSRPFSIYVE